MNVANALTNLEHLYSESVKDSILRKKSHIHAQVRILLHHTHQCLCDHVNAHTHPHIKRERKGVALVCCAENMITLF